jgi:hypothetical protein
MTIKLEKFFLNLKLGMDYYCISIQISYNDESQNYTAMAYRPLACET